MLCIQENVVGADGEDTADIIARYLTRAARQLGACGNGGNEGSGNHGSGRGGGGGGSGGIGSRCESGAIGGDSSSSRGRSDRGDSGSNSNSRNHADNSASCADDRGGSGNRGDGGLTDFRVARSAECSRLATIYDAQHLSLEAIECVRLPRLRPDQIPFWQRLYIDPKHQREGPEEKHALVAMFRARVAAAAANNDIANSNDTVRVGGARTALTGAETEAETEAEKRQRVRGRGRGAVVAAALNNGLGKETGGLSGAWGRRTYLEHRVDSSAWSRATFPPDFGRGDMMYSSYGMCCSALSHNGATSASGLSSRPYSATASATASASATVSPSPSSPSPSFPSPPSPPSLSSSNTASEPEVPLLVVANFHLDAAGDNTHRSTQMHALALDLAARQSTCDASPLPSTSSSSSPASPTPTPGATNHVVACGDTNCFALQRDEQEQDLRDLLSPLAHLGVDVASVPVAQDTHFFARADEPHIGQRIAMFLGRFGVDIPHCFDVCAGSMPVRERGHATTMGSDHDLVWTTFGETHGWGGHRR